MGLVGTMTALVLGLLISSAKSSFDALSSEITGTSSKIILLDRTLANYGADTKEARDLLRSTVANIIDQMELKKLAGPTHLAPPTREVDSIYYKIQGLLPKDDRQRSFQDEALSILKEIRQTRWLMYEQQSGSISMPMLVILVSWLTALFISFGLYAPANGTVVASLLVSALSVSAATLLILEMYSPQMVAPTGQYSGTKLVNWGSNRWAFKPELGYSGIPKAGAIGCSMAMLECGSTPQTRHFTTARSPNHRMKRR
jgi:Putative MetA-pathway of phenol degradation